MSNEGCIICEKEADGFTACPECVVDVYLEFGQSTGNDLMEYLKKHNRARFDMLITKYAPQNIKEEKHG